MEVGQNKLDFLCIQNCQSEILPNKKMNEISHVLDDNYDVVSESTTYSIENSGFNLKSPENGIEIYERSTETIGHFGNIEIENSSNITFGNKTFLNGPMVIKQLVVDKENLKVQHSAFKKAGTFDKKSYRLWLVFVSLFVVTMIIAASATGYWLSVYGKQQELSEDSTTPELPLSSEYELPSSPLFELSTSPPYEIFKNRSEWVALLSKQEFKQLHDVKLVIIAHTATSNCSDFTSCANILQSIQSYHMNDGKFDDIGYNFMVGGDGVVYEGRGYHQGAHTLHYNENSICISFIGDFTLVEASKGQLSAVLRIIEQGLRITSINPEYILCGQLQLRDTLSPGYMLYKQLMLIPHWSKDKCAIE